MASNRSMLKFLKADLWEEWRKQETDQRKGMKPPLPQKPYPQDAVLIALVEPDDFSVGQIPLINAIRQQRSRREYSDEALNIEELSFLLWATQGIDQEATRDFREWLARVTGKSASEISTLLRTVPSGGACHPFETYLGHPNQPSYPKRDIHPSHPSTSPQYRVTRIAANLMRQSHPLRNG